MLIVHAPSETMDFYKSAPQRLAFQKIPKLDPPTPLDLKDPALPVDSADGGCDTPDRFYKAWTRQHAGIEIGARMKCLLIRDPTDSMYDPNDAPHVSHDRGTALIVEHIEKYRAPTLVSADLLKALH
ncbi:MAG: hypothetical protein SFV51_18810 [Bryobacteraceae bacterium]|nr:hypothetical protein [Bryobacteraceae bacterium]